MHMVRIFASLEKLNQFGYFLFLTQKSFLNRNECFSTEVIQAQYLCLTVFHDSAIPPDDFVANCIIPFEDILTREEKEGVHDLWVGELSAVGRS